MSDLNAYCSWCYKKSNHKLIEKNYLRRNIYQCQSCLNMTLQCRYCKDMSKGQPSEDTIKKLKIEGISKATQLWDNELCAEHDGTIASFSKLDEKIKDITDYKTLFEREKYNLNKVAKYSGLGVTGIISVAGVAVTAGAGAAPIAAALGSMGLLGTAGTGTVISTLSGAALTNASLAAIGGSMAVGTAIVSGSGLALGGVMGGVIANKYHGEDKSFDISKLKEVCPDKRIIFINGFTQEKEKQFKDWQLGQAYFDKECSMYSVTWGSKTNAALGKAFAEGVGTEAAKKILTELAKAGGKGAASKLTPLGWLAFLSTLAGNPWHNAMFRAAQTGVQVAEAISRTEGKKFTLVGHSLGCRVIYYALEALATKKENFVNDVILLGGAVGKGDIKGWENILSAVNGKIYNCYSKNDQVLSKIYIIANAGLSSPIGISPIDISSDQLCNIDCSNFIDSHMTWKENYDQVLGLVYK